MKPSLPQYADERPQFHPTSQFELELRGSEAMQHLFGSLEQLQHALLTEDIIEQETVSRLSAHLPEVKVQLGSRILEPKEVPSDREYLRNAKRWEKILAEPVTEDNDFRLAEMTLISPQVAQHLVDGDLSFVPLGDVTFCTQKELDILSGFSGGMLSLGLESLTSMKAEILSRCQTQELVLNKVENLTPEVLRALSSFKGGLSLMQTIHVRDSSGEATRILSEFEADELSLGLILGMTPEDVETLASYQGLSLTISGISLHTEEMIQALCAYEGELLQITDQFTMTPEVAAIFATFKGTVLTLVHLDRLDPATARALVQFGGARLSLPSLDELDIETVSALLEFHQEGSLYLPGLKAIEDEALQLLGSFSGELTLSNETEHRLRDLE